MTYFICWMQRPPIVGILTRHDFVVEHIHGLFPSLNPHNFHSASMGGWLKSFLVSSNLQKSYTSDVHQSDCSFVIIIWPHGWMPAQCWKVSEGQGSLWVDDREAGDPNCLLWTYDRNRCANCRVNIQNSGTGKINIHGKVSTKHVWVWEFCYIERLTIFKQVWFSLASICLASWLYLPFNCSPTIHICSSL